MRLQENMKKERLGIICHDFFVFICKANPTGSYWNPGATGISCILNTFKNNNGFSILARPGPELPEATGMGPFVFVCFYVFRVLFNVFLGFHVFM